MLTQNEISSLSLSPTKKDFVQIWNELLEVAGKLSERWDPTSTNESDPGIVILKALAGIADKLNYNIDKNTLEAFMPTAAQEDSMRKLCEMLGYNVKYYRSAKTDVTIKHHNTDPSDEEAEALQSGLLLPKFSIITNSDQDVSYFTINETPLYITATTPTIEVTCMEGQLVQCESINDNNVITANQISENNRFYLPETQIAENGIFVYNIFNNSAITGNDTLEDGLKWEKVENLNVQVPGSAVYKFGYDSYEGRPYLEFPEDYAELFGDGLFIYYARTSGAAGNISARTLTKLEFPSSGNWGDVAAESISVENAFSATTGANIETIKQAYNNFKKTVGTFETLVTCRDYMNKIYSMQNHLGKPLVSNILVTDIRNDLNRALTICSCDRAGIFYKETPIIDTKHKPVETLVSSTAFIEGSTSDTPYETSSVVDESADEVIGTTSKPVFNESTKTWHLGGEDGPGFTGSTYLHHFANETDAKTAAQADGLTAEYGVSSYRLKAYFDGDAAGEAVILNGFWVIKQGNYFFKTILPVEKMRKNYIKTEKYVRVDTAKVTETKLVEDEKAISHFDLVLYPFKSYTQIKNNIKDVRSAYDSSFNYSGKTFSEIKGLLDSENIQTIAHTLIKPRASSVDEETGKLLKLGDTVSINNYLRLNATIATTSKITIEEGSIIIDKIKIALANAFNMRELDFGEEIPFDNIVEVMENADSRIRLVSLNEPALYTTFSVFSGYDSLGNPETKEYAVASDWLTLEQAVEAERFDMDKVRTVTINGEPKLVSLSTFNTKEARELYNKMAVRNVLAGRVPLFDYNNTFKTSFSEGAYQITKEAKSIPASLPIPDENNPFTICTYADKVYTGQYVGPNEEDVKYTETYVPDAFENNVISSVGDNEITDITTSCKIFATNGEIENVELAAGEFVKFRAPNFTTIKTYPAYVNYHLALNTEVTSNAVNAEAVTLFDVLNSDKDKWTLENRKNNWQRALDYFEAVDKEEGRTGTDCYKKTIRQSQDISAYAAAATTGEDECTSENNSTGQHKDNGSGNCVYCGAKILSPIQKSRIIIDINDKDIPEEEKDLEALLNKSGCIRFSDAHDISYDSNDKKFIVNPILTWKPNAAGATPAGDGPDLDLGIKLSSLFITSSALLTDINEAVQTHLEEMVGQVKADGSTPMLPTEGDWTISFEYVGVPFEPKSLSKWKSFIISSSGTASTADKRVINFTPYSENDVIFWRVYGEGYSTGKYILQSTEKLLDFGSNYFGLLPESRLRGIYLIKDVGKDAQEVIIANDEEYRLRANEYLYIEYTPSTTSEDGTTKDAEPVTEILGEGTIIKPSGFEVGLRDSSVYAALGTSYHKTVTFVTETGASKQVSMHRFGANEQVEVRDFAKVELTKKSFKDGQSGAAIYYYKNFNGCEALEDKNYKGARTYTLKDGEYIFYTDQNKAEFAYFTTGTEVSLEGSLIMDQFDVIELSTIFDSGISEIPWGRIKFATDLDKVVFQEFQYITLGPEDTINKLTIVDNGTSSTAYLNENWQYCDNVEYSLAGSEEVLKLSAINTFDDRVDLSKGCGWQASSTLELDVAYNSAQILRNTKQVQTSITLSGTSLSGAGSAGSIVIMPEDEEHPLAFKTNLTCQTSSTHINIDDIYTNPKKLTGFELKVFANEEPAIVETLPGKLVPYDRTVTDITNWPGDPINIASETALWKEVALSNIRVQDLNAENIRDYDKALRLPVSILPNTYGVFTIYVDYTTVSTTAQVWIEVLPGTSQTDLTLFNISEESAVWQPAPEYVYNGAAKLLLKPGINCIRVNKTGRLFIKASADAQGSIFFDDLKLVNSTPISYIAKNQEGKTKEIPASTYGLNVKQLGYLNPDDVSTLDDTLAVDEEIREKLIASSVDSLHTQLEKTRKSKTYDFTDLQEEATKSLPKLQTIIKTVEDSKTELENILNTIKPKNSSGAPQVNESIRDAFHTLFNQYTSLSDELKAEEELLKTLNENKNLDILDSDLLSLLSNIASKEETQQKLLEELELLKTAAVTEMANVSRDMVEADFTDATKTIEDGQLVVTTSLGTYDNLSTALEKASRELIEQAYNAGMLPLINSIDTVVNSEERAKLLTVLSTLKDSSTAAARAELLIKVKQVIEAVDKSELDGLADTMLTAAINASYKDLDAILVRLKAHLTTNNLAALIAELEVAALESNDTQLMNVVVALSGLVSTGSSASSSLVSSINDILALITNNNLHDPNAKENTTVTSKVKDLYGAINTDYKNKLTALLDLIYKPGSGSTPASGLLVTLSNSNTTYTEAVTKLQDSADDQVAAILRDIEALGTERTTRLAKLVATSDGETTYEFRESLAELLSEAEEDGQPVTYQAVAALLPFGDEAVYKVWSGLLLSALDTNVEAVNKSLMDQIKEFSDTTTLTVSQLSSLLPKSSAKLAIFAEKVANAVLNGSQEAAFASLVSSLPVVQSTAMTDALAALSDDTQNQKNQIVRSRITAYTAASTAAERQKAAKALKEALTSNIATLNQLVSALAKLLCPSLLNLESCIPDAFVEDADEIYDLWISDLEAEREKILGSTTAATRLTSIENAFQLFTGMCAKDNIDVSLAKALEDNKMSTLIDWLLEAPSYSDEETDSRLSEDLQETVTKLKTLAGVLDIIAYAKAEDFTAMTADEIESWLDSDTKMFMPEAKSVVRELFNTLASDIETLSNLSEVAEESKEAYNHLRVEQRLLKDLQAFDVNRDFYYTSPTDLSLAIEFNESDSSLNTLMNPATNYDVNNINNSFVISKLDIDYLDRGIQIARSSRLN